MSCSDLSHICTVYIHLWYCESSWERKIISRVAWKGVGRGSMKNLKETFLLQPGKQTSPSLHFQNQVQNLRHRNVWLARGKIGKCYSSWYLCFIAKKEMYFNFMQMLLPHLGPLWAKWHKRTKYLFHFPYLHMDINRLNWDEGTHIWCWKVKHFWECVLAFPTGLAALWNEYQGAEYSFSL